MRDEIAALSAEDKTVEQIVKKVHQPQRAVSWVIEKLTAGASVRGTGAPPHIETDAGESSGGDEAGGAPSEGIPPGALLDAPGAADASGGRADTSARARAREGDAGPSRPAMPGMGVGGHGMSGPALQRPPPSRSELLSSMESISLSDVTAPNQRSPLAGTIEVPSAVTQLAKICEFFGIPTPRANGIAMAFALQVPELDDPSALYNIITSQGYMGTVARQVVETYKKQNTSVFGGGGVGASMGEPGQAPSLEELRKRAGLPTAGPAGAEERMVLAAEIDRLNTEKLRLEIQEKRKGLGLAPGGAAVADEEDPITTIMLNINGFPQERRVRQSQIPNYAQWMGGPSPAGQPQAEEMPAWAKAMDARLSQISVRDEEERRERATEERIRAATGPLEQQLKALTDRLTNTGGQDSAAAKELSELRTAVAAKDKEEMKAYMARLETQIGLATTPEGMAAAQQRYERTARTLGFIPAREAGLLNEDQIVLEAQRRAALRKDEATGTVLNAAGKRLDNAPGLLAVADRIGVTPAIRDRVRALTTTEEERAGVGEMPSDEEMAAAARALEHRTFNPVPPAAAPPGMPPPGAPPASDGAVRGRVT